MQKTPDLESLHSWFLENRRSFPWRDKPTPYRVWISEVMLQQTRSSVVIPYFERWMRLFPDLSSLAEASLEEVIKAWEGLGYYSRARHLHEGARQIVRHLDGKIPSERELLEKIKGLGPYTTNAILSFAFHKKAAPVDGNAARVVARHFLVEEDVARQSTKKQIQELADSMLDPKKPWITAEALIELGATICLPRPLCDLCPLRSSCRALKEMRVEELPLKAKAPPLTPLTRSVAVVEEGDSLLVKRGAPGKVMADLFEFPYFEGLAKPLPYHLQSEWGLDTSFIRSLPFVKHSFTRYSAHLFPIHLKALQRKAIPDHDWIHFDRLRELPFSSGHRKILESFLSRNNPQLELFS